jgi:3-oxoacyl-[acyl-carrier protein] reductase
VSTPAYPSGHALLDGKVVVVTAAAGAGIGGAAARRCLEEGARVVISDAHERRLGETLAQLRDQHGEAVVALPCDVTVEAQVQQLVGGAVEQFGRVDVMINNAGLGGTRSILDMTDDEWSRVLDVTLNGTFRCTRAALRQMVAQGGGGAVVNNAGLGGTRSILDMTDDEWSRVLDVTLNGTFRCTRAALRQMVAQGGGGAVVNNASVLGWRAQEGQAHYAAAKAGVMALTRCAALDAAGHNIRVNAVSPSLAMHPHLAKVTGAELLAELTKREAFGRYAEPWEVANVMVFLASDYASYLTGEVLSVSSQHP